MIAPFRTRKYVGWTALLAMLAFATPTNLPAQTSGRRHRRATAEASPTPTPQSEKPASWPKPAAKPSSEQEVAPSKRPADSNVPPATAVVSSIEATEIEGFDSLPEPIRQLLAAALELTRKNLTYAYGSDDPAKGGMDCSGTISYLLKSQGFADVPRQASEQYAWVRHKSRVYPVLSKKQENAELAELRPGDLMFWTGTYNVDRDPPVTHTMIYLGRRKKDGHRLMFGSSDGRPYDGQKRNGVSVFDFRMPAARDGDAADVATAAAPDHAPDFAGYGPIPGIADLNDAASRQTLSAHESTASERPRSTPRESGETSGAKPSPTPRQRRRPTR